MSCNTIDTNDCGCSHEHDSKCIFYTGQNLTCIDVVSGDDLTTVLANINNTICSLTPSSVPTVVLQEGSGIDVTSTTVDGITTYTIALDSSITTALSAIGVSIATINACLSSTVREIVSTTLYITEVNSTSCGKKILIESIAPSSIPLEAGIIYNNTSPGSTNGGGGIQMLKALNTDYIQYYNLTTGDVIEFTFTGQLLSNNGLVDDIIIELFDETTATVRFTQTINGWNNDGKSSYNIHGILDVTGATTGLLDLAIEYHSLANGLINATRRGRIINKDVTGIDYSNLTIRLSYDNVTGVSTDNFGRQLKVEVKKLI
jgi:hypothetical protein